MHRSHLQRTLLVSWIATGMFAIAACDDGGDDSGNNGALNNGSNNSPNNGTNDNNGTNNNPNNGSNNNPNNGSNNSNNGTISNNGTNNSNNGTDEVALCQELCGTVTACQEFLDACGESVATQALSACQTACADDAEVRAQILAVGNLPCATVVPLAIDGFGLTEVCTGAETACDTYCGLVQTHCSGDDALYADDDACQAACAAFATTGSDGDTTGDTLQCRTYHAGAAADDAATHCPHAGPDGGGVCAAADLCANVTCTGDDLCNPATGACELFVCAADEREPDNDAPNANSLTATDQTITGTICDGDEDWFGVPLTAGQSLRAVVRFVHRVGDIELRLRDEDGTTSLDNSTGTGNVEVVFVANVTTARTVYVVVDGFSTAENAYTLTLDIDPAGTLCDSSAGCLDGEVCFENLCQPEPPCSASDDCTGAEVCETETGICRECVTNADCRDGVCADYACVECVVDADCGDGLACGAGTCAPAACANDSDPYEPNETADAAWTITAPGTLDGAGICGDDDDWFSFTVAEGDDAYILIAFRDSIGDIDAELLDANGDEVDASTSTTDNESLVGQSLTAGVYNVHVYGYNGASNAYSLTLELNPTFTLCARDADCTEPNFECRDSQCQVRPPCTGDADCDFDEVCQVDTGVCVGCLSDTDCATDEFCIGFECADCRDDSDCGDGYACDSGACAFVACLNDPYEPNNTADTAIGVSGSAVLDGAAICGTDVDFFSIDLAEGDNLYLLAEFIDDNGNIELELRDVDGTLISGSTSSTDNESVVGRNLAAGKYFAVVDGSGTVNNVYTLTVVVNPEFQLCTANAQCGFNELCVNKRCETRPACAADSDCLNTEVCEVGTGICRECLADADCGANEVCNPANLTCVECLDDNQCTNGAVCAGNACVDPACLNDPWEGMAGNNTRDTATDLTGVAQVDGAILCGDNDWYAVPVAEGESVHIFVAFTDADGDIDVALSNAAGTTIDTSISTTDNEVVYAENLPAGIYYLRVYNIGTFTNNYALTVTVGADVPVCASSSSCTLNEVCTNNLCVQQVGCTADTDCRGTAVCDIPTGLCYECVNNDDCGTSEVCAPDNTCVECVTDNDCAGDNVCVEAACVPALCGLEVLEPNNTRAEAIEIAPGTFDDAICGDEDWYSFQVNEGEDVWLGVLFTDDYGDIDAALSTASATSVDTATSGSDNEYLTGSNLAAGVYNVRIYSYGDSANSYALDLRIGDLPICGTTSDCADGEYCGPDSLCGVCDADRFEPNDTAATAANMDADLMPQDTLNTCGGPDFFAITLTTGQIIDINVSFVDARGDIDAELLKPDGTRAGSSAGTSDNEHIRYTADSTGVHVLRVYGYSGAINDYTLSVTVE